MAAFQPTPTDISIIITSPSGSSNSGFLTERRITPTWSIMQLKSKLETMTGVPPSSQRLLLKTPGRPDQWIVDGDGSGAIGDWGLVKGCEIEVCMILFFFFFFFGFLFFFFLFLYPVWLEWTELDSLAQPACQVTVVWVCRVSGFQTCMLRACMQGLRA